MSNCSIAGCEKPFKARNFCTSHYHYWYVYGDPLHPPPKRKIGPKKICAIDGCDTKHHMKGWCNKHYLRWKWHGDPLAEVIEQGQDPEKVFCKNTLSQGDCLLWIGGISPQGYGFIQRDGRSIGAHRYAWERVYGPIPEGMFIDHMCHVRNCVAINHLRLATPKQNMENLQGARRGSYSGYRNVYWRKGTNKWFVTVGHDLGSLRGSNYYPYELHIAAYEARKIRNSVYTHNIKDRG